MLDSQNDDNLVKIDFSEPFSKNCHNKEKKVTYKRSNWAIAHNQGNIDEFVKSHKIEGKLNGKLTEMVIDSGSEQTFVRMDLIKKTEIDHKNNITTLCYYGDKHQCPSAWVRIEIAKKDGTVQRKTIKVGLVPTLAVDVLLGGDFGDIFAENIENKTRENDFSGKFPENGKLENTFNEYETLTSTGQNETLIVPKKNETRFIVRDFPRKV